MTVAMAGDFVTFFLDGANQFRRFLSDPAKSEEGCPGIVPGQQAQNTLRVGLYAVFIECQSSRRTASARAATWK